MSFNIVFDYRYDASGFFTDPARRAALEEAARIWEAVIGDEFDDVSAGISFTILNPSNGVTREDVILTEAIDDLLIFVGARDLGGNVIGQAGPSGFDAIGDIFTARITDNFRGQGPVTDFEPWAGVLAFDIDTDWNFSLEYSSRGIDFITVALHEIAHVLGFSTASTFSTLTSEDTFSGANTLALTNGVGVPLSEDGHVQDGYANDTVLMDPTYSREGRTVPGDIDKAILADIGYEIAGFSKQGARFPIVTESGDVVLGTDIADTINGQAGDDQLQGAGGSDLLSGGAGDDVLIGQAGNDMLNGGRSDDQLFGGDGDDVLAGGSGDDQLLGQNGRDTFVLSLGGGQDVIGDFELSTEVIRLVDSGFDTTAEALAAVTKPFSTISRVTLPDGSSIDVLHAAQSGTPLSPGNFVLERTPRTLTEGDDISALAPGNEVVDGLGGFDTATLSVSSTDLSLQITASGLIVTDRNEAGSSYTLSNFERLALSDRTVEISSFDSASALSAAQFSTLAEMYVAYFNRAADAEGLYFWADALAEGLTLNQIAAEFFSAPETQALYTDPSDTNAFVNAVYSNVLGRTPDADGLAFWLDAVGSGAVSQSEFVLAALQGAKAGVANGVSGAAGDIAYLTAKTNLGVYFSAILGMSDTGDAQDVMQLFGDQATSNLDSAKAAADAHFRDATAHGAGDLLMSLVGVVDDPFAPV